MEPIKERIEDLFKTEVTNYHGTSWATQSAFIMIAEKLDSIENRLLNTIRAKRGG